ncbi:hypothetical protein GCM10020369_18240 [Cryptosporangium minutisporangium]|uniref:Uncharacterized protein n=1 Tax=Cryptosporangium minutisporangium TaxID=113569 RepID=A0ABP6STZ7_9ACTN
MRTEALSPMTASATIASTKPSASRRPTVSRRRGTVNTERRGSDGAPPGPAVVHAVPAPASAAPSSDERRAAAPEEHPNGTRQPIGEDPAS